MCTLSQWVTVPHNLLCPCRVYKNLVFQASLWLLAFQLPQGWHVSIHCRCKGVFSVGASIQRAYLSVTTKLMRSKGEKLRPWKFVASKFQLSFKFFKFIKSSFFGRQSSKTSILHSETRLRDLSHLINQWKVRVRAHWSVDGKNDDCSLNSQSEQTLSNWPEWHRPK